jgi:hypothetical protein
MTQRAKLRFAQSALAGLMIIGCLAILPGVSPARGDDAAIVKELTDKGAKFTETKGVVTAFALEDCTKWTDDDFRKVAQLTHLTTLNFSKGLDDAQLALLTPLTDVEYIQTNQIEVTDDGLKSFKQMKKLRNLKFFHPGKSFTGVGLAQLTDLLNLQSLTVAGSLSFADEGMAAVGKLKQLHEFRSWHAGPTAEGVAKLKSLPVLKSLNLGQRLAYKPPTTVSDQTVAVLIAIPSLESIQLSEARMTFDALSQLKQLANLKTLTLDNIDIPEADIERLRKELPKVQIKWTKPDEKSIKRIKAMFGAAP